MFSLWTSRSTRNFGSKNVSSSVVSDLLLNKESSKHSSKEISSTNNHSLGQVWDLKIGLGLSDPSYLLIIIGMRLGFSNTGGGFGSGLALVYLLETSVVKFIFYNVLFQPRKLWTSFSRAQEFTRKILLGWSVFMLWYQKYIMTVNISNKCL